MPDHLSDLAVDLLNNILKVDPAERYDIDKVKLHPWFNIITPILRPGITIGKDKIPIDENILAQVEEYGFDKEKCKINLENNKYDSITSIYYLCLRKFIKQGGISISDLVSDEYLNFVSGSTIKTPRVIKDQKESRENNATPTPITHRRKSVESNELRESSKSENNTVRNSIVTVEPILKKEENINVNVNLNVNLNLNTTNNINITQPKIESKTIQADISYKNNPNKPSTQNISITNTSQLKSKLKEYSSSIASPASIKEISFINNNLINPNNNSIKNSFLAPSINTKEKKKGQTNSSNINNNTLYIEKPTMNSGQLNSPGTSINNNATNKDKIDKPVKPNVVSEGNKENLMKKSKPASNTSTAAKNKEQTSIKSTNNTIAKNYNKYRTISNRDNKKDDKEKEKEVPSKDNSNANIINHSDSNNNLGLSDSTNFEIKKDYADKFEDEEFDDINSNINVLEFIAKKLVGTANVNINFKKENSSTRKKSNASKASNSNQKNNINDSFSHNRSSSQKVDINSSSSNLNNFNSIQKQPSNKKSNNKKVQSADQGFSDVINILNKKYKTFFESQKNEINMNEIEKDDDVVLCSDLLTNNINNDFITKIANNINQSNNTGNSQNKVAQTLKKTKVNNYNRNKYNKATKIVQKRYQNDDLNTINTANTITSNSSNKDLLKVSIAHKNKFLDISATYDPDLDSRGESSVDSSFSQKSNLRNMSFSPDVTMNSNRFRSQANSYTQNLLKRVKREINLNLNINSPNHYSNVKNVNSGTKTSKLMQIGVISEDDEFNNNFNVSVIKASNEANITGHNNNKKGRIENSLEKDNNNSKFNKYGIKMNKGIEKRVTINLASKDKEPSKNSNNNSNAKNKKKLKLAEQQNYSQSSSQNTTMVNVNNSNNNIFSPIKNYNKNFFSSKNANINNSNISNSFVNNTNTGKPNTGSLNKSDVNSTGFKSSTIECDYVNSKNLDIANQDKSKVFLIGDLKKGHRKTPSAMEFNPNILAENNNEFKEFLTGKVKQKHNRNRSQIDKVDGFNLLNSYYKSEKDSSSFIIKSNNEVSLLSFINKNNEEGLLETYHKDDSTIPYSDANPKAADPSLREYQKNSHFYNTERKGKDQNIANFLEEFYGKPSVTNRSERTTSSIFNIIDKDSERLKIYSGPIDIACITSLNPCEVIERILDVINKKKISFVQTNPYKLRCSKKGISFDIEIYKMEEGDLHYIKFKSTQKEYMNYRKFIISIMNSLKLP